MAKLSHFCGSDVVGDNVIAYCGGNRSKFQCCLFMGVFWRSAFGPGGSRCRNWGTGISQTILGMETCQKWSCKVAARFLKGAAHSWYAGYLVACTYFCSQRFLRDVRISYFPSLLLPIEWLRGCPKNQCILSSKQNLFC